MAVPSRTLTTERVPAVNSKKRAVKRCSSRCRSGIPLPQCRSIWGRTCASACRRFTRMGRFMRMLRQFAVCPWPRSHGGGVRRR